MRQQPVAVLFIDCPPVQLPQQLVVTRASRFIIQLRPNSAAAGDLHTATNIYHYCYENQHLFHHSNRWIQLMHRPNLNNSYRYRSTPSAAPWNPSLCTPQAEWRVMRLLLTPFRWLCSSMRRNKYEAAVFCFHLHLLSVREIILVVTRWGQSHAFVTSLVTS